ncbi:transcription factor DIVARICATA-like [Primulina eburnea]|uniref:transcription factor DIVARICATA-like n=1 Tax=Primulina eburnea TaxID=1245227 RepID=UPI003C6C88EB
MYANFRNHSVAWDWREDKIFENCLVEIPDYVENRWQLIAQRIPGKSAEDVRVHYEVLLFDLGQIHAGMIEPPSYPEQTVSVDCDDRSRLRDSGQISFASSPARSRHLEVDRKKGTPWTEHEHRLFLLGLKKYGKGDWRSISRNLIVTKTPTQVASHAQKYFLRQSDDKKVKKRSSIHDITTTIDSLTVPAQLNYPVPDQAQFQYFPSPYDVS